MATSKLNKGAGSGSAPAKATTTTTRPSAKSAQPASQTSPAASTVGRVSGDVRFAAFALLKEKPEQLRFQDHMLPYEGQDDMMDLPCGVYGTTSITAASLAATQEARAKGLLLMTLNAHVYLENFSQITQVLPNSLKEAGAFLHMGRLGAKLRHELHEQFLLFLRPEHSDTKMKALAKLDWGSLLTQQPAALRRFMREQLKGTRVMVHPVIQSWGRQPGRRPTVVQVGSFRLTEPMPRAEVAYNSTIQVSF